MIIGVAQITANGVHHIMIELQAADDEKNIQSEIGTLCGTDAPEHFDLFNDEWAFVSLEDALEYVQTCDPICTRCLHTYHRDAAGRMIATLDVKPLAISA
jgi:hypothetical protein